jgi:hypothetical protein
MLTSVTGLRHFQSTADEEGHVLKYLSRVRVKLNGGFGLEVGFIGRLQIVTTNNYNTIDNFHTLQITTAYSFQYFQLAFTSRFPVTVLNNGDSSTAQT